jgi:hypothetical protein
MRHEFPHAGAGVACKPCEQHAPRRTPGRQVLDGAHTPHYAIDGLGDECPITDAQFTVHAEEIVQYGIGRAIKCQNEFERFRCSLEWRARHGYLPGVSVTMGWRVGSDYGGSGFFGVVRLSARHLLVIAHTNFDGDLLARIGALAVVVTDSHRQIVVTNGEPYLEVLFTGTRNLLHGEGP